MDYKRLLWKTFSIQRDEFHFVFPLFILYFLSGSFFASGQIYSETLFLKTYGAKGFAGFFIQNGIAIIIAGIFYNYFLLKLPLRKGYVFIISSITTLIASSFLLQNKNLAWLPFYIYMANYLFTFFLDIHFFNYAFQFLSIRNSKRILPFLMGAGKLGGIASSLLIYSIFSKDISKYGIFMWAINGALIIIPLLMLKKSTISEYEKANIKGHELLPDYKFIERIMRKIKLSTSSPVFTYSVLAIFVMAIANQVSEYYFASIINTFIKTKNELSSFLSLYTFFADLLTLFLQFFIISRIIRRIGVFKSNLIYPVSFFSFISLCIAFPNIIIAILIRFYRKNLSTIVRTPIFNVIMAASPRDRMTEVKSFISGIVSPFGMIVGGGAILLIYKKFSLMEGYIFSLGIGILFITLSILQNRAYLKSLKDRLSFDYSNKDNNGLELHDYESLLSEPDKLKENLATVEIIFNEKPSLELLPFLRPYFNKLRFRTKENILNMLKTSKSDLANEFISSALQDPDPLIRGTALSFLTSYSYNIREKLLANPYPNILESEKHAISILLARDGKIDAETIVDDFVLIQLITIKNAILNDEMEPIEFIILIQVLPYQYLLNHLIELSIKTRDVQFLKSILPYANKLTYSQVRKVLHIYRDAPMDYLSNFLMLCKNAREIDKALLLDYKEMNEEHIKNIFQYDEKTFRTILKRLFKNKNYRVKSNYLKFILMLDKKPENVMKSFIDFEINNISNIYVLKNFIIDIIEIDPDTPRINFIKLSFINILLNEIIELHKHLILKAIAIISGFNIDDIHDANILLRDKDLNSYILEYIESESSVKQKNSLLSIFDDEKISQQKKTMPAVFSSDLTKKTIKEIISLLPEISNLLELCFSQFIIKSLALKAKEDSSDNIQNKITGEDIMISLLEKIIFLKKNKLFSELKIDEILHIAKITREIDVPSDKTIINQGEKGTQLFILISGEVEVYTDERVLANLGPGSCIGELSIIDEEPRSANVKTIKKTKILSIDRKDFLLTVKENPSISINIMQVITDRLRSLI